MKTNNWQTRENKYNKAHFGHQEDGRSTKLLQEILTKRAKGELRSQKKKRK